MRNEAAEHARFLTALGASKDRAPGYNSAYWLESDYECGVWNMRFGPQRSELNFAVRLEDGRLLTDPVHQQLLRSFKSFLLVQTHLELTRGVVLAPTSAALRIMCATHVCDYLLMNSRELRLHSHGLQSIGESDGYDMLRKIATMSSSEAVYQWRPRLTHLLRIEGAKLSEQEIADCTRQYPELANTPTTELGLSYDERVRARCWLQLNQLYVMEQTDEGKRLLPRTAQLIPVLYPAGTLNSTWKRTIYDELCVSRRPNLMREMPVAPVRGHLRSEATLFLYVKVIGAWSALDKVKLDVPNGLMQAVRNTSFLQSVAGAPPGRYRTLPHGMVLQSLRHALEFWLAHGKDLLDAYVQIISAARAVSPQSKKTSDITWKYFFPKPLKSLGVRCWSIFEELKLDSFRSGGDTSVHRALQEQYFRQVRENQGFYELLQVLGGSLLILFGTLMARRQGEVMDLVCGQAMNATRTRLLFDARKRNSFDVRERIARPAPPILAEILSYVERFQQDLVKIGLLEGPTRLLSFPSRRKIGLGPVNDKTLNTMLDTFCDYFSLPTDSEGRRYYIRQHQLRRFFAIMFFWGNSYAGLDCLRWFLGHADVEHLYHYITHSISGEMLRGVKVDFVVEQLQDADIAPPDLLEILERRFGTRLVKVLDQEELGEYIEELLIAGRMTIEPEFFTGPSGKEYRILILVTPKEME